MPYGEMRRWEISFLDLRVQRREGEWRIWHETQSGSECEDRFLFAEACSEPETANTMRFVANSEELECRVEPRFPDRPIVSYPGSPVIVPPRSKASFVCGIPIWIDLIVGNGESSMMLATLPLRQLSKTWFGSPQDGEACYSASTEAVRDHNELASNKHRALCPLTVTNKTSAPLPIERICVHVEHLQLLDGEENLWTHEVFVRKASEHDTSQVSYGSGNPGLERNAILKLSPRVVPPQKRLILKTFNHLKTVLGNQ
ncbi:MAG: DUF432 domain-containing protein [Verrucomicrobiales bacterium]|nr:DUF432 domain-containing protein [Verrucomicrobiales bacterium]